MFRFVSRYPDVLIVPWLLNHSALYAYIAVRLVSLCIPVALIGLNWKAALQLRALTQEERPLEFQAAAARINLGYLMICGAIALLAMSCGPSVIASLGVDDPSTGHMLRWLVIGQAAPVLFGATGLLMRVLERHAFYDLLVGLTSTLFLVGLAVMDSPNGIAIAQTFAAAQLTLAAICALLLMQCGIWPGLTALFHKEIKLF
jgi:hypothetical protein